MSTYAKLKTNPDMERDGVLVDYGPEVGKFYVRRVGGSHRAFENRRDALLKPYTRQIQAGLLDDEVFRQFIVQAFAEKAIVGWDGVTGEDGELLEYSEANAVKLFTDLPTLFDGLYASAQDHKLFLDDAKAAASGN